jgi:hypothetical protein
VRRLPRPGDGDMGHGAVQGLGLVCQLPAELDHGRRLPGRSAAHCVRLSYVTLAWDGAQAGDG